MQGEYIIKGNYGYYKENKADPIWEVERLDDEIEGEFLFSFDGEKVYDFFYDYPQELTPEERELFDKEYPEWAEFYKE